jgi:hypothetical protein
LPESPYFSIKIQYRGFHGGTEPWQPVALVDFCAINNAKIPIIGAARTFGSMGVCGVKNRLIGDFLGFYARSTTNA